MAVVVLAALVVAIATVVVRSSEPPRAVTVRPGETLTEIVVREMPGKDFTRALERVEQINHLAGSTVTAGQVVRIPEG